MTEADLPDATADGAQANGFSTQSLTDKQLGLQEIATRATFKNWTGQDPEAAVRWYEQLTDEKMRKKLAEGIATGLTTKDRAKSIERIHCLPEGRVRDSALVKLADSLRAATLNESLDMVQKILFEPGNTALESYYRGLCFENAGEAIASFFKRLESATDPDERQAVEKFLDDSMIHPMLRGEAVASRLLERPSTAAGSLRLNMLERVAMPWAENDMASARKWLESLPSGEARIRAITGSTQSWAWSAQAEASAWID